MALIRSRMFTEDDVRRLVELEASIFPLTSPIPLHVVHRWTSSNSQFSRVYYRASSTAAAAELGQGDGGPTVGSSLCIALKAAAWERLIRGQLEERDLGAEHMFSQEGGDTELAIHMYHVENEDRGAWKQAGERMWTRHLQDLGRAMNTVRETAPASRCVGFSALSVTADGIHLCSNIGNMYEPEVRSCVYMCEDHNGRQWVETANSMAEYVALLKRTKEPPLRARMLITRPGDPSIVWRFIYPNLSHATDISRYRESSESLAKL